jgi:hypothetical protein
MSRAPSFLHSSGASKSLGVREVDSRQFHSVRAIRRSRRVTTRREPSVIPHVTLKRLRGIEDRGTSTVLPFFSGTGFEE